MSVRLSSILEASIAAVVGDEGRSVAALAEDLAIELQSQLHAAGFAIHASDGRCVRPKGDPRELGRPMTLEELAELAGLCADVADRRPDGGPAEVVCVLSRRHEGPHAYGSAS